MEIALANATSMTATDPVVLGHLTRAGSSFGIVTKIKLEIYKRPSPISWVIPVFTCLWTVEEAMYIYRKIWSLEKRPT